MTRIYQIRVDQKDLFLDWIDYGFYRVKGQVINFEQLKDDLKSNGLEIISSQVSDIGRCYYFTVKGQYCGNIKINKI